MSKLSSVLCLSGINISRRWYGVQARAVNERVTAAAGRTDGGGGAGMAAAAADGGRATKKDVFWMRDPKTGCWIPENRFDEVDVVELRNRLVR